MGCCTSSDETASSAKPTNDTLLTNNNNNDENDQQKQKQQIEEESKTVEDNESSKVNDENENSKTDDNGEKKPDDPFAVDDGKEGSQQQEDENESKSPNHPGDVDASTAPPSPEKNDGENSQQQKDEEQNSNENIGDEEKKENDEEGNSSATFDELVKQKTELFLKEEEKKQEIERKDLERKEEKVALAKEELNRGFEAFFSTGQDDDEEDDNDNNNNNDETSSSPQRQQQQKDPNKQLMKETKSQVEDFKQLLDKLQTSSSDDSDITTSNTGTGGGKAQDAEKASKYVTQIGTLLQEVAASEAAAKALASRKPFEVDEQTIEVEEDVILEKVKAEERKEFEEKLLREKPSLSEDERKEKIEEFQKEQQQQEIDETRKEEIVAAIRKERYEELKQEYDKETERLTSSVTNGGSALLTDDQKREKLQEVARLIEQSKEVIEISGKERRIREDREEEERKKKLEAIKLEVLKEQGQQQDDTSNSSLKFDRTHRVKEARDNLRKGLDTLETLSQGEDMMLLLACKDECEDLAVLLDQLAGSEEGVEDSDKATTLVQKVGTMLQQLAKEDFAESEKMEKQRKVGAISQLITASRNCIQLASEERVTIMNQKAKELEAAQGVKQFTDVDSLPEAPQSSNGSPTTTGRSSRRGSSAGAGGYRRPPAVINDFSNSHNQSSGPRMLQNLLYSPPDSDEDDDDVLEKKKKYFEERKRLEQEEEDGKKSGKNNNNKPKGKLGASSRLYDPNKKKKTNFLNDPPVEESAAAKRKKYAASLPPASPKRNNNSKNASSSSQIGRSSNTFLRNGFGMTMSSSVSASASTNHSPKNFLKRGTGAGSLRSSSPSSVGAASSPNQHQRPPRKHDKSMISNIFGNSTADKNRRRKTGGANTVGGMGGGGGGGANRSVTMRKFSGPSSMIGAGRSSLMSSYNPALQYDENNRKRQWGARPVNITRKSVASRRKEYSESIRERHQQQKERFGSVAGNSVRRLVENSRSHYSQQNRRRSPSLFSRPTPSVGRYSNQKSHHQQPSFCSSNQIYPTFQNQHSRGNFSSNASYTSSEEAIMQLMHSMRLIKSKGFSDMPMDARSHVLRMVRDTLMTCKMQTIREQQGFEGVTGQEIRSRQHTSTLNFLAGVEKTIAVAEKNLLKAMTAVSHNNNNNQYNHRGNSAYASPTTKRNHNSILNPRGGVSPSLTIDLGGGPPRGLDSTTTTTTTTTAGSPLYRNHRRNFTTNNNNINNNDLFTGRTSSDFSHAGGGASPISVGDDINNSSQNYFNQTARTQQQHLAVSAILQDTSKILSDLRERTSPIRALLNAFKLIMSPDFLLKSMPYERDQVLRLFQSQIQAAKKYVRQECPKSNNNNSFAPSQDRRRQLSELIERVWNSVASVHFPQKLKMNTATATATGINKNNTTFISVRDQEHWLMLQQQRNNNLFSPTQNDKNLNLPHQVANTDNNDDEENNNINNNSDDAATIASTKVAKNTMMNLHGMDDVFTTTGNENENNNSLQSSQNLKISPSPSRPFTGGGSASAFSSSTRGQMNNNNNNRKKKNYRLIAEINDSLLHSRRMLCAPSFSIMSVESQQHAFDLVQEQINRVKAEFDNNNNNRGGGAGLFDTNTEPRVNQLQVVLNAMRDKLRKRREEVDQFRKEEEEQGGNDYHYCTASTGQSTPGVAVSPSPSSIQQHQQPSNTGTSRTTTTTPQKKNTNNNSIFNKNNDRYSKSNKLAPVTAWSGGGGMTKLGGLGSSHWMFASPSPNKKKK